MGSTVAVNVEDVLKSVLGSQKLDMIGLDACLMAMVETAYVLLSVGNYLVASEDLAPALGWKYDDWLEALELFC